jgi:CheY-like chemotaxis protein
MARRLSVLLADPNADTREMYAEFLRHAGFDVIPVDSAADALTYAPVADVAVTGIALRGEPDGVHVVRQLRRDPRTTLMPVIVLTACTLARDRKRAETAGCDLFVLKPCLPEDLLQHIRRVVMQRRARVRAAKAALSSAARRKKLAG